MKSINNICLIVLLLIILIPLTGKSQSQADYFNKAAKQYVNEDMQGTSQLLAEGLEKYPQDAKLNALWEKLKKDQEDQEKNSMESDLSEREKAMEELKQRLEQMNITPEQAAQILDAMNSNELRYIQQNKKKPTQQPKRGLPDY